MQLACNGINGNAVKCILTNFNEGLNVHLFQAHLEYSYEKKPCCYRQETKLLNAAGGAKE